MEFLHPAMWQDHNIDFVRWLRPEPAPSPQTQQTLGLMQNKTPTQQQSTACSQLTLSKIIKTVATRCQILRLKCTKFNFGAGGAYSAPPDPLSSIKGAYF